VHGRVPECVSVCDQFVPTDDGKKDQCFISTSYDGTSHFESTSEDVLNIYKRIIGKDMDLTPKKQEEDH